MRRFDVHRALLARRQLGDREPRTACCKRAERDRCCKPRLASPPRSGSQLAERVERRARVHEAIDRSPSNELAEKAAQFWGDVEPAERGRILEHFPRLLTTEQVDQRCAEPVEIGGWIDDASELLDRHVPERAYRRRRRCVEAARRAEIDERDRAVAPP